MLLAKSCEARFHIKHGTIKLGTLYEYREIENDELVDKGEGMLTFHINFHGQVTVPRKWFSAVFGGAVGLGGSDDVIRFPGRVSAHVESLRIVRQTESDVVLENSAAVLARESLNSFVFCMSRIRKTRDCVGIFKHCDDYWYFHQDRANEFANRLGQILFDHIVFKHSCKDYILPPDTDLALLEIYIEHRLVDYVGREVHLYGDAHLPLEVFVRKMMDMAFTKPDSYVGECEYRFNYIAVCNGQVVEPIVKSVFLDSSLLQGLVF